MSDRRGGCHYDVRASLGERACPFNAPYGDFLARHAARFADDPPPVHQVRAVRRMDPARPAAPRARATGFSAAMDAGEAA